MADAYKDTLADRSSSISETELKDLPMILTGRSLPASLSFFPSVTANSNPHTCSESGRLKPPRVSIAALPTWRLSRTVNFTSTEFST